MSTGSVPPPLPFDNEETSPAPRRRWLVILGLAVGIPVGCIVLLGGLGWLMFATAKDLQVLPKDQAVVIQVEDVSEFMGEDFSPQANAESLTKIRYLDGSYEVDYTYQHPDGGNQTLYLSNTVDVLKNASEAVGNYHVAKGAVRMEMWSLGETNVIHTDRNDLFRWGDESSLTIISSDGVPVGNMFCARKGKRVFTFLMIGLYFDEAEGLRNLLGPKLARLESYEP